MPKSKRAKVVTLSRVEKKGKELTLRLFANVRASVDRYEHCFVFAVDNMRNTFLKDVRQEFADSRLVVFSFLLRKWLFLSLPFFPPLLFSLFVSSFPFPVY
jgi:hypothetical protein